MKMKLAREVRYRAVSHGHEEHATGDKVLPEGTWVRFVGPSKIPGHNVIQYFEQFIRVKA